MLTNQNIAQAPLIDRSLLILNSVLCYGATSTVFRASYGGISCAAKVMNSEDIVTNQNEENAIAEIEALSKLGNHLNIVQFHGVCVENSSHFIIVIELVDGKDLRLEKYLSSLHVEFDLWKATIQKWSLDLLLALDFLHNRDPILIHCDVKPANLLITPYKTSLKLTDFGISKSVDRDQRAAICHLFEGERGQCTISCARGPIQLTNRCLHGEVGHLQCVPCHLLRSHRAKA